MKLSAKSRYGTRLVLDIALNQRNGPVRIQDVSERQSISVKYLERIVQELRKAGYIKSRRGYRGGHMLAVPPEQISVGAIVRVLEEGQPLVECARYKPACPLAETCLTRRVWMEAGNAMFERLDSILFSELIKHVKQGTRFYHTCSGLDACEIKPRPKTDRPAGKPKGK